MNHSKVVWGDFSFDKVHLTYRVAYDSISGLSANNSEKDGDIRFENDLREATVGFVYNGLGSGFFRPGRQIVSWCVYSPS